MRFSLKWLLAGVAYVALAAVAIRWNRDYLDSALWSVATLAAFYAVAVCFASRFRQAFAFGFALLWAAYVAGILIARPYTPSSVALRLFGYSAFAHTSGYLIVDRSFSPAGSLAAVDALGTMIAGVVGGALAVLAYKRHGKCESA